MIEGKGVLDIFKNDLKIDFNPIILKY